MNDLISRLETIYTVNKAFDREAPEAPITRFVRSIAVRAIGDVPSAETFSYGHENDWIPVSERLPEDYQDVLVWFEYFRYGDYNRMYSTYGIGNYSNRYDSWLINHETGWTDLHVFAWMPMPEPYKEGESE